MDFKSHIAGWVLAVCLATPVLASDAPQVFATPQDALDGMMDALVTGGEEAVLDVFGTAARDLVSTGNPLRDSENRARLLQLYADGYRFRPAGDGTITLLLGRDGWPFPVPLARGDAGWVFDVDAGRDEVLFRRIGLNELDTIEIMYAYVEAQSTFRSVDQDGDGVMEFASGILPSAPDVRDGLFWRGADSIMGELIALAELDGYNDGTEDQSPQPFGGYYFRILSGQGPAAPGGEMAYSVGGHKVAGHAMLAVPADYGNSGIHSFLISENGILYEADLGETSLETALDTTLYNPAAPWRAFE